MNTGKKIIAVILIAVMSFGFGLAGGLCADWVKEKIDAKTASSDPSDLVNVGNAAHYVGENSSVDVDQSGNVTINVSGDYTLAEAIAEKVMPSVVSVTCTYEYSYSYGWSWGGSRDYTQEAQAVGTGFIVDSNGYIVTNSHVVHDGDYKSINISLYDGSTLEGQLLWNDSTLDLAVVKIDKSGLAPVELGDSDQVKIGSYAAAIGNPLGLTFERSMSQGIISGLDRTITVSSSSSLSGTTMEGLLQTDAAINSGNSGGPLLNSKGQVIGVASAKASSGESMGFAIPINVVKPIIEQIVTNGSYERVYLGITAIGIEQQTSVSKEALEEYYGSSTGIYVASVSKGGGADRAGLQEGDVILTVNGTKVGTMNKMYSLLVNYRSGDVIHITFLRNGQTHEADVELMTSAELEALGE
ncbi:MAG: trypsin-like peptidase domain-containing protein [Firmicutes bacterium]|nr:trypsin-like peptidase domain-containing protein [Bacillota bacterium]